MSGERSKQNRKQRLPSKLSHFAVPLFHALGHFWDSLFFFTSRICSKIPSRQFRRSSGVEASWSYPQFLRQLINAFARPHPLHGHSLKFPGVSLPLHGTSFPGNCAQYCVSLQAFTPMGQRDNQSVFRPFRSTFRRWYGSPFSRGNSR